MIHFVSMTSLLSLNMKLKTIFVIGQTRTRSSLRENEHVGFTLTFAILIDKMEHEFHKQFNGDNTWLAH